MNENLKRQLELDPKLREELWRIDYLEKPVDIDTFICNPYYLGRSTDKGNRVYPVWRDTLRRVFNDKDITEVILTGSIGGGKTSCAVLAMSYVTYRTLCLRNPYEYYNLLVGKPLSIVFFSVKLSLSSSTAFMAYQRMMQNSQWFLERGELRGTVDPVIHFPLIDYKLGSPRASGMGSVGADVISACLDEINAPGEAVSMKQRVFNMYQGTVRRIGSRFMKSGGKLPSIMKMFLCASKDDELSFVDKYIEHKKNSVNVCIIDKPIWEIKPGNYSGVTFPVVLGDKYHDPKIITDAQRVDYADQKIVNIPIEHLEEFRFNLIGALRDCAGLTTKGLRKQKLFQNIESLTDCYDETATHPFSKTEIEFDLLSEDNIINYFKLSDIKVDRSVPRFIHIDVGVSHDSTGIACSYVAGVQESVSESLDGQLLVNKLPVINTEWVIRVNPRVGSQIPIAKIKKFILDLYNLGFNIAKVTTDGYQSTDLQQTFIRANIPSELLSVDKTPDAYIDLRDLVSSRRWSCYKYERLHFELYNLEVDSLTGKINHPEIVKDLDANMSEFVVEGTKDCSDAVAASVHMAIAELPNVVDEVAIADAFTKFRSRVKKNETELTVRSMFKVDGHEMVGVKTGPNFERFSSILDQIHNRRNDDDAPKAIRKDEYKDGNETFNSKEGTK